MSSSLLLAKMLSILNILFSILSKGLNLEESKIILLIFYYLSYQMTTNNLEVRKHLYFYLLYEVILQSILILNSNFSIFRSKFVISYLLTFIIYSNLQQTFDFLAIFYVTFDRQKKKCHLDVTIIFNRRIG